MEKIIFLVGESGCGKTTLQNRLINSFPNHYTRIISTTTREPREGEVNGESYHFIDVDTFQIKERSGEFLQTVKYGDTYYGTQLNEYTQKQYIGLFVCTPEGINDTINAIKEYEDLNMIEYEIAYFMATKGLLKRHNIPQERIDRGNISKNFMERYWNNEFEGINLTVIPKHLVNDKLHHMF